MSFTDYIKKEKELNRLVVQPRMGYGKISDMKMGLTEVYKTGLPVVGTITLDSYTRVNKYHLACEALKNNEHLNGFPIVSHGVESTREMISSVGKGHEFALQVRHGTSLPKDIFKTIIACEIDATEGGPISYCLPYSRTPISDSIENWMESCCLFADARNANYEPHIESFAGCMLGQLCPPGLSIALVILECLFFRCYGIRSVSLSHAQCINPKQDVSAITVLKKLASELLGDIDWHVVMYSYMGLFPTSVYGSFRLITDSAKIAKSSGCERLIIKTPLESYRIPTIEENISALEAAYYSSCEIEVGMMAVDHRECELIYFEAKRIIEAVLNLDSNINSCFSAAFEKGVIDIPFCLHPENKNNARSYIDDDDYLKWLDHAEMPLSINGHEKAGKLSSKLLLKMLSRMREKYDGLFYSTEAN